MVEDARDAAGRALWRALAQQIVVFLTVSIVTDFLPSGRHWYKAPLLVLAVGVSIFCLVRLVRALLQYLGVR